jgi:DNA-directed RNA polymerase specialized sigma24 family protein
VETDHFPSTHATWIDAQLTIAERGDVDPAHPMNASAAASARAALRRHLMERYYDALRIYVRTSALVRLGEPEEIVAEFFVRAVDAPDFLRRWRDSKMPLRRWMMNAMAFHCRGELRDQNRSRNRMLGSDGLGALQADAADPARAFDHAWAVALANEAMSIAIADADERGRPNDALAFRLHVIDGMPYRSIAAQLSITVAQAEHAARRVSDRMREAVREILREEGVLPNAMDAAVAEVLLLVDEAAGEL